MHCYSKLHVFKHLSVLSTRNFNLVEVGIIVDQDAFEIQKASDNKRGTQSEPFAVLTALG